jgi:hypothetical protein
MESFFLSLSLIIVLVLGVLILIESQFTVGRPKAVPIEKRTTRKRRPE